jgi:cation transport ATPase
MLSQITKLVEEAQEAKPNSKIIDIISSYFVPIVMRLQPLCRLLLRTFGGFTAMLNSIAVLIIACPYGTGNSDGDYGWDGIERNLEYKMRKA